MTLKTRSGTPEAWVSEEAARSADFESSKSMGRSASARAGLPASAYAANIRGHLLWEADALEQSARGSKSGKDEGKEEKKEGEKSSLGFSPP